MLIVSVTPQFRRMFKKLVPQLQEEALEKLELLKNSDTHTALKVHKLHGSKTNQLSFSVNYKIRVVFQYISDSEVVLMVIGTHDVYK